MIKVIMGASASGKDYIQNLLIKYYGFNPIISTTSRPIRDGEVNGKDYHFVDKTTFLDMIRLDELIEYRTYNTLVDNIPDTWYYGLNKQQFDDDKNYVVILDVQGCRDFINYVGEDNVEVYYICCNYMIRTERAMNRGGFNLAEWNRRLEDDARVFSKDNMVGINYKKVMNQFNDINNVIKEIMK